MKLKFILLFVFISNLCVGQNYLHMHGVTYKNGNPTEKNYYLFEMENVKLTFLDADNHRVLIKGAIEKIADSFLIVNSRKIIYDSIIILAFNKNNNEFRDKKNAAGLMIIPLGLLTAAGILRSEEGDNITYGYKTRISEIVFSVGSYITGGYLPMFLVGFVSFINVKKQFFLFDKNDNRIFSLKVIHQTPTN